MVAPLLSIEAPFPPSALLLPTRIVPLLTTVQAVVLLPKRVRVPIPYFSKNKNCPATWPANVMLLEVRSIISVAPGPLVLALVFPKNELLITRSRVARITATPSKTTDPDPSAALLPNNKLGPINVPFVVRIPLVRRVPPV